MTQEQKTKNLILFFKKLNSLGIDTTLLEANLSKYLEDGVFKISGTQESTEQGSLLNIILRHLTPNALKINEILQEEKRIEQNSLIKVCLLHQLGKALMFEPTKTLQDGRVQYGYAKSDLALKMGMRSICLCLENGIPLNTTEIEAISSLDRDPCDAQVMLYSSPMAVVLRQAVELTNLNLRN